MNSVGYVEFRGFLNAIADARMLTYKVGKNDKALIPGFHSLLTNGPGQDTYRFASR